MLAFSLAYKATKIFPRTKVDIGRQQITGKGGAVSLHLLPRLMPTMTAILTTRIQIRRLRCPLLLIVVLV